MFQATVRKFARERIAPHVRAMDEAGVFRKELIREFFDLGLMAIDVPEEYGGQGGYFFQSILAIEELANSRSRSVRRRDRRRAEYSVQQCNRALGE